MEGAELRLPEDEDAQQDERAVSTSESPPDVVARQVQFALSQLPAENAAHRFEELCRHVARVRLVPNLIPATGPVGAGGDQGRDFETYRTYLAEQLGKHGGFAGRLPSGAAAFACTLQQEGLPTKIRDDVAKICGGGVRVETVYCFLVVTLPVGVRHGLQEELARAHSVHVEVLDLHWLAEELADGEIFWIAERYLSLPASLAPPRRDGETQPEDELSAWYLADRARWREREPAYPTIGDLLDVRDGLRHATINPRARADLPFWLSLVEPLCTASARTVRQRARYEVALAQMRGMGDLSPADGHVADFLAEIGDEDDPARLSDAGVLLTYATVAYSYARSTLTLEQLVSWGAGLREHVEELLADEPPPVRRARLLEVVGQLCLARDAASVARSSDPIDLPDVSELVDAEGRLRRPIDVLADHERFFVDLDRGLSAWTELAKSLPDLPIFPVDSFAHSLEILTILLVDEPAWASLVEAVDVAVARAEGDAAAGDRALSRGYVLIESGRVLEGLRQLHSAKWRFFHGDHVRSFASTLLAIGDVYGKLHLPQAARQYALAAVQASRSSGDDEVAELVPHGLLMASRHDYRAGNFASALQTAQVGLAAQMALVNPEVDQWADRDLSSALMTVGMAYTAAHTLVGGALADAIDGLLEPDPDLLGKLRELSADLSWTPSEWAELADAQLDGRPFADLGERREIRFAALGLSWTIHCRNDFLAVACAERLAAAAQVLSADLAAHDLLIVPTAVTLEIPDDLDAALTPSAVRLAPDRDGQRWTVHLSRAIENVVQEPEATTLELMTVLAEVLLDVSLLSRGDFFAVIESSYADGVTHKLCPVRPYDELIPYSATVFERLPRREAARPLDSDRPPAPCHEELAWASGPGPGYSAEVAQEMLQNRYERIPALMPVTLGALRRDRRFATTISLLRARGWRDWHILTAVYNMVLQVRLQRAELNTAGALRTEAGQAAAKQLAGTPEATSEPAIALAPLLNIKSLDHARQGALTSLVRPAAAR